MRSGLSFRLLCLVGLPLLSLVPTCANAATNVRITGLSNVAFGTIANFTSNLSSSQSICIYSNAKTPKDPYQVTARGSGSGGAFTLASGSNTLAYQVQWSDTSGQTTGTALTTGVALTNQTTNAAASGCTTGPITTASLIIILPSTEVQAAGAGSYTGTLTLVIAPN